MQRQNTGAATIRFSFWLFIFKQFQTLKCCKNMTKYSHIPFTQRDPFKFHENVLCRERIPSRILGWVSFSCHLWSPSAWHCSSVSPWLSWPWSFWRSQASHIVACLSVWVYLNFLVIRPSSAFLAAYLLMSLYQAYSVLICALIGSGGFDHLRKVCQLLLL